MEIALLIMENHGKIMELFFEFLWEPCFMLFSESTQDEYNLTSTVTEEISSNHFQEAKGKDYALSSWVVKPVGTGVCIVGLNRYVHRRRQTKFSGYNCKCFLTHH